MPFTQRGGNLRYLIRIGVQAAAHYEKYAFAAQPFGFGGQRLRCRPAKIDPFHGGEKMCSFVMHGEISCFLPLAFLSLRDAVCARNITLSSLMWRRPGALCMLVFSPLSTPHFLRVTAYAYL
jgi:hypothetical protein